MVQTTVGIMALSLYLHLAAWAQPPLNDPSGLGGQESAASPADSDRGAYPVSRVAHRFPREALMRGLSGCVIYRFTIDKSGRAEDIRVDDSTSPLFEPYGRAALQQYVYEPLVVGGESLATSNNTLRLVWQIEGVLLPIHTACGNDPVQKRREAERERQKEERRAEEAARLARQQEAERQNALAAEAEAERRAAEQARADAERKAQRASLLAKYPAGWVDMIMRGEVDVGWTEDAVREALGAPVKIQAASPGEKSLEFKTYDVIIIDGRVTYVSKK